MAERPAYAIVGRGRWAGRVSGILAGVGCRTSLVGAARQLGAESDSDYRARLAVSMAATEAQIAWLCVPPGRHVPLMIEAAVAAGLHVVAEKPWICSPSETELVIEMARAKRRVVAVHYEYCFLDSVEKWRREFDGGTRLSFGGNFTVSSPDSFGIDPIDNLGSHLLAIREYAVPRSEVTQIRCGYEQDDERSVCLEEKG